MATCTKTIAFYEQRGMFISNELLYCPFGVQSNRNKYTLD